MFKVVCYNFRGGFHASDMLGVPNVYPSYGDNYGAYCPAPPGYGFDYEFIEVIYFNI